MTISKESSQWACIQQNIGVWHGAFEQFSPDGERVKETPSVLTLEETEPNKTMILTLERSPQNEPKKVNKLTFTYPGPAPYTYFFESGAFSQGASQWSSFGQFVTEFSMKVRDRRVRFVIAYEGTPSYKSVIKYVTLICETQAGGTQFVSDSLSAEQLLGTWQGAGDVLETITGDIEKTACSRWQMSRRQTNTGVGEELSLQCEETLQTTHYRLELTSDEKETQTVVPFQADKGGLAYQLMLMPKGAYALLPREIRQGCDFRIEVGWVSENKARSRFTRYYDSRGVWTHSSLINDAHK